MIFSIQFKNTDNPNIEYINNAHDLVKDFTMMEPSERGRKFTWTNRQMNLVYVRLDID